MFHGFFGWRCAVGAFVGLVGVGVRSQVARLQNVSRENVSRWRILAGISSPCAVSVVFGTPSAVVGCVSLVAFPSSCAVFAVLAPFLALSCRPSCRRGVPPSRPYYSGKGSPLYYPFNLREKIFYNLGEENVKKRLTRAWRCGIMRVLLWKW